MLACLTLNAIAVGLFFVRLVGFRWLELETVAIAAVLGIGISQLVYVIPVAIWAKRRGMKGFVSGVVIGAAITFLLNGACWGWFLIAKPRIGG
jgi:hypothetical protein